MAISYISLPRDVLEQSVPLKKFGRRALIFFQVTCAVHFLLEYIEGPRIRASPSMLSIMGPYNEVALEYRLTIRLGKDSLSRLKRGDLIVATSPLDPGWIICKRILGLPGDVIAADPSNETMHGETSMSLF